MEERGTFRTWLNVAKGLGVEENWRVKEGRGVLFGVDIEIGIRTDGIKNLRSIETAIVVCDCLLMLRARFRGW